MCRRPAQQRALTEWAHDHNSQSQISRQRQDDALDIAFQRIVGNLDRADAPCAHDGRQLVEGRRAVVRRPDDADLPGVAQPLQCCQMLTPGDEVVNLIEVNAPAEVAQRPPRLRLR